MTKIYPAIRRGVLIGYVATLFGMPLFLFAEVRVTEIMYDLSGSDAGREWIEVYNDSSQSIDLATWKLYEADVNHAISSSHESSFPPGSYAIIADNPEKFLADYPNFGGHLFDSSFSLSNSGEYLEIRDETGTTVDSIEYGPEYGAAGNELSLHILDGELFEAAPSPGESPIRPENREPRVHVYENISVQKEALTLSPFKGEAQKHIKAYAGEDTNWITGAPITFEGSAVGTDEKELTGARFLWNVGDGSLKHGQKVEHVFAHPGEYVVVLDVAAGEHV